LNNNISWWLFINIAHDAQYEHQQVYVILTVIQKIL